MKPDAFTVLYKMLAYANSCLEEGVSPDLDSMQRLSGADGGYFRSVVRMAMDEGLLHGLQERPYLEKPEPVLVCERGWGITLKGCEYLRDAKPMHEVASALGTAFASAVASAIAESARKAIGF